ncbi:MAG: ABC transporter permease, partial [Atribacterota bacterium]
MMSHIINPDFFASAIRIAIPLALAGLGGVYSEKSGVVNIGLEGIMLTSAFAAVAATNFSGNVWVGILIAAIVGILLGLIHAIVTVSFKANQIVSGVAINLFASGITVFLSWLWFHETQIMALKSLPIWGFRVPNPEEASSLIKGLIVVFAHHSPMVYISFIIIVISNILIFRTPFGLRLRS